MNQNTNHILKRPCLYFDGLLHNVGANTQPQDKLGSGDEVQVEENQLNCENNVVARDGVEPPPPAFSGLDSLSLTAFSINNLIRQGGHSFVTIL